MGPASFRRALRYAFYDWTREMALPQRVVAWTGLLIQGWAIYALWTRSLVWPVMWPRGVSLYVSIMLLYFAGAGAANIQALVRSIAGVDGDPRALARRIDMHLARYTPSNRFATAAFVVLSRASGELTYVNAGHNPPMLFSPGSAIGLEATGPPLGLVADAAFEARSAHLPPGGMLLLYTDGLTDSIPGDTPETRLREALAGGAGDALARLTALVDPNLNGDDVAILLVTRDLA